MAERVRAERSDAKRNRGTIMEAAMDCLAVNPRASMAEIATAAGVGRVTLYGHFSSRTELVDAIFERVVAESDATLEKIDLTGDPAAALDTLIRSSWQIVHQHSSLLAAATSELDPAQVREHHDTPMRRVAELIDRGKSEGVFRSDFSTDWQVACFYALLHGTADEIRTGRIPESDAADILARTLAILLSGIGSNT